MGRHRAAPPNYAARRIAVGAAAVVVVAGAAWLVLRGGGGGTTGPLPCAEYRQDLIAEYRPLRAAMRGLVEALAPVDAGEEMTDEQVAEARAVLDEAEARYDAIDALRNPPPELKATYDGLRPTLNEFVALARRTVAWLEGTEPAKPTETPSEQLRLLLESPFLARPEDITCTPAAAGT